MNTTKSIYKLLIHEHPLFPSAQFLTATCAACHVRDTMYGGYFCNESSCNFSFHKDCAETPLEINHHLSHLEHPLLLTNDSPTRDGTPCGSCGQKLLSPYYTCPTCEFKVDLICGIKPSPSAIEHPVCHDHPLVFLKKQEDEEVRCELCKESIGGPSYSCLECNDVYFHLDCVHLSKEVNHPCHSRHPLKIMAPESLIDDDANIDCRFCGVQPEKILYHCSICNFNVCIGCTKRPLPLVVDHTKTHMHPLRLFSRKIVFTCNLCGVESYDGRVPYICLECDFIVHSCCVGTQVININRHDHRISFAHHLIHGRAKCGVCRQNVRQYYGAYSCSICPNYTVHSQCAYDYTVWNGVELEGIPEISEDTAPFKVVGDDLIRHFTHEKHSLRFVKDCAMLIDLYECLGFVKDYDTLTVVYEWLRCEICIRPIGFGPIYVCPWEEECFILLHEKCANLPMKKKLVFDPTPYKLEEVGGFLICNLCGIVSGGFMYKSQRSQYVDIHCGSISEPFFHDGHLHPLYFGKRKSHYCDACKRVLRDDNTLTCGACNFDLCLYCATLPEKIWHMSDEHPLTLYYSGKGNNKTWCEVCEMELDPSKWFFTCPDCGVTLHVQCVLGDFSRLKLDWAITVGGKIYYVDFNYRNNRPFCTQCHYRCNVPVILKVDDEYICSISCLNLYGRYPFY